MKVAPYFAAHPNDLVLLPGYILFGWFHSLIKLYALFTLWDIVWGGRHKLGANDMVEDGKEDMDGHSPMVSGINGKRLENIHGPSDERMDSEGIRRDWVNLDRHSAQGLD